MNPPWVYTCPQSWTPLPPPSQYHPSGSSQCTSPKHPVSCIKPGMAICFLYDIIHVSMPFSQIIPHSPSPTESKRLFYTSVSLLVSHIPGCHYHLSKFHIYALVYCIGVFLSGLLEMIWENGIETCIISYVKWIARPGSMHGTRWSGLVHWDDPEGWYGEEGGRGFRIGDTCTPVVDSCWCMEKSTQYCKVISLQLK